MQMGKAKPFPNTRKPYFCNTYKRNWLSNPEETYEFSFPYKRTDTQVEPTIKANLEEQPYEKERRERDVLREGHALLHDWRTCPGQDNFFWQGSNFHRSPAKLLYRCLCTTNFSSYSRKLLWEELNPAGLVQMLSKQQNNGNWKYNPVKNAMKTTCSLKNCVSTIAINLLMVNLNKTTHTSKFF